MFQYVRPKQTAVCVGGPFAGQALPMPSGFWLRRADDATVGPVCWVQYGTGCHAYVPVQNAWCGDFRLIYADSF